MQKQIDDGTADESLMLLKEVGGPAQARGGPGGVRSRCPSRRSTRQRRSGRRPTATCCRSRSGTRDGFAAASLMMYARVGFLRTLPPPAPRDVQRLHRTAHALGVEWPAELLFPDFILGVYVSAEPQHAAMYLGLHAAASPQRNVAFDGEAGPAAAQRQRRVRPRDRAAAPARRPLRLGGLHLATCRHRGARLGARRCPTWP